MPPRALRIAFGKSTSCSAFRKGCSLSLHVSVSAPTPPRSAKTAVCPCTSLSPLPRLCAPISANRAQSYSPPHGSLDLDEEKRSPTDKRTYTG